MSRRRLYFWLRDREQDPRKEDHQDVLDAIDAEIARSKASDHDSRDLDDFGGDVDGWLDWLGSEGPGRELGGRATLNGSDGPRAPIGPTGRQERRVMPAPVGHHAKA